MIRYTISPALKKTCARQVVLDEWLPLRKVTVGEEDGLVDVEVQQQRGAAPFTWQSSLMHGCCYHFNNLRFK